jgi:hypothetical protein
VILLGSLDGRKPELALDSTFVAIRGEDGLVRGSV